MVCWPLQESNSGILDLSTTCNQIKNYFINKLLKKKKKDAAPTAIKQTRAVFQFQSVLAQEIHI